MFKERNIYTVDRGASKNVKFYWVLGKFLQVLGFSISIILWAISEYYIHHTNAKFHDIVTQYDNSKLLLIPLFIWVTGFIMVKLAKLVHWWDRGGIS